MRLKKAILLRVNLNNWNTYNIPNRSVLDSYRHSLFFFDFMHALGLSVFNLNWT